LLVGAAEVSELVGLIVDQVPDARGCGRRMRPFLGTFVEIGFRPAPGDHLAVQAAYTVIEEVERRLSFQDERSELSRLNRCRGAFVALSPLSVRVLRLARAMTVASGGLFNCTLGGALVRRGVLPDHGSGEMLDVGGADDIEIRSNEVRLARPVRLTLDGIAKGYAVDLAVSALRHAGVQAGWVNAGGDLRVFGALILPVSRRESDGTFTPLGGVREGALASSAVCVRPDRRFPGTILGGTAGLSAPGVWSVLARRAWRADALTKVAALAPDAYRESLLRQLGGRLLNPVAAIA
jgi:FAD:protein FMN transferase